MIPCQRALFDIPDDISYLNCGYLSPLPRRSRQIGERAVGRKGRPWELVSSDFFDESEALRRTFAAICHAAADDVALIPAVSYGVAVAAKNLRVERRQSIVVLREQFPSNVYGWRELAKKTGAAIVAIERPADGDYTSRVLEAIDARTAIAALPHCHWTDGLLIDLVAVRGRLDEIGGALVVDATQSLGALPLDVREVRPDFMICAGYKWLLGPYSVAFLYARPDRQDGEPLEHNWIARARSEDFAGLVAYRDDYQPGARRYDVGERSNFALNPIARASLELIESWGVGEIAATLGAMTDRYVAACEPVGLTVAPRRYRAGHYLGLRLPGGDPARILERFRAAQVHVSVRGTAIRVTPHLYNDDRDLERFVEALAQAL